MARQSSCSASKLGYNTLSSSHGLSRLISSPKDLALPNHPLSPLKIRPSQNRNDKAVHCQIFSVSVSTSTRSSFLQGTRQARNNVVTRKRPIQVGLPFHSSAGTHHLDFRSSRTKTCLTSSNLTKMPSSSALREYIDSVEYCTGRAASTYTTGQGSTTVEGLDIFMQRHTDKSLIDGAMVSINGSSLNVKQGKQTLMQDLRG
jgi:hypothetical protein